MPPYATTDSLKYAFTNICGEVHSVTFANTKGFKTAYIVFKKESSLDKVLELPSTHIITLHNEKHSCLTGVESELYIVFASLYSLLQFTSSIIFFIEWCKEYNDSIYNEKTLKQEIDEYMSVYDKQVENHIAKEKAAEEEDEEGWITVTGGKKRGQFAPSRKESTIGKVQQKEEQRKKKKQLLNFYTFQVRESKKQSKYKLQFTTFFLCNNAMLVFFCSLDLAELRKKFEQDKKRLQELKSKRTFKPF